MKQRRVGRPREIHGPLVNARVPALVDVQIKATAKIKGQSRAQVIRECLVEGMKREWES